MKRQKSKRKSPAKKKNKKARPNPADSFVAVARRLGADEDKGRFEATLGKIARATK